MEEQSPKKKQTALPLSLTDLPETAVDEILCRLPIKDAARTAVLSRSWRHRWRSIPDLRDLSGASDAAVTRVLLLHHWGPLRLFRARAANSPAVSDWIAALSRHSAATLLTLDLSSNFYVQLHSLARFFPRLAHLRLSGADLAVLPAQFQFPSLRTLHLDCCRLCCGRLSALISACPALETLNLLYFSLEGRQSLHIVAPNVRSLKLVELNSLVDFRVTSAPALELLAIDCCVVQFGVGDGSRRNCNEMKILEGMACLKRLELGASTLKFLRRGNVPQRLDICFDHLRFMSLSVDFGDVKEMLVTLCLLRSAPNLQELEFKGCFCNREMIGAGQGFWESQACRGLFDKLESVKMAGIDCVEAELAFMRVVLATAQVLKTMRISFGQDLSNKEFFIKKLLEFPRVSNQVRMQF